MFPNINPTDTKAWQKLQEHYLNMKNIQMKDLFSEDQNRVTSFSVLDGNLYFDYSKNICTYQTMNLLRELANECKLQEAIEAMFTGEKINATEKRSVLHTALRSRQELPLYVDHKNVRTEIASTLGQMRTFCQKVISGTWKGYTGKPITDIVNIGIGGSDLGPVMVTEALRPYQNHLKIHFVSNVDGTHIAETIKKLNPETCLFLIASKTFTTQETMANAHSARNWFLSHAGKMEAVSSHFAALSTNRDAVIDFGIDPDNMFIFWDWVGGRYSLTSAIGLSIMLSVGPDHFFNLLAGFEHMDNHFRYTPLENNIPVIMALLGIWYVNFFDAASEAILPYDQYLHRFAAYFQQANMESNGKSVDRNGLNVTYDTGPVIWGEPGTNGQHAFYQLIHQGTQLIPCDFIAPACSHHEIGEHHTLLISNFLAQTQALMSGKSAGEVKIELEKEGKQIEEINKLLPYKVFSGNRPTNSILVKIVDPFTLGSLIAMYEHKIFVQGVIWNIYSFDQWGVELGKQLANKIIPVLNEGIVPDHIDASTRQLITQYRMWKN